jgi:hypothetical protein
MIRATAPMSARVLPGWECTGRISYCPRVAARFLGRKNPSLDRLAAKERQTGCGVAA